ncbi:Serine/threonine-protein kinase RIO3 [Mactra antiquata]
MKNTRNELPQESIQRETYFESNIRMEGTITEAPQTNAVTTSPWSKSVNVVTPCSLEDVMSEQLAGELQEQEKLGVAAPSFGAEIEPELQELINATDQVNTDTSSDVALARMLQMQYDREHNELLRAQEKQYNGANKVTLSFDNYKHEYPEFKDNDDDDNYDDDGEDEPTPWEQEVVPVFNAQGYAGKGKNITTKHDSVICGRKNASKMMNFPPEFESGDGEGMDMKLPNNVYNKLKRHSEAENKRNQKLHEKKEHSTAEQAMDPRTRLALYKMVNNGSLESINGTVCSGKESVVLHALGGVYKEQQLPPEVAIKVYKTTLSEFKTREKYVHGDHRFSKDDYKKQNPRKIIMMWAMKEAANLNRMKKYNIPCPTVYVLKKHVVVMSFIGDEQKAAPKLKHTKLSYTDYCIAYEQIVSILKKIYRECCLVHADLSEYNILWWKNQVWIIDVSQSVDITHPSAMEFLYRDCSNIINYFKSKNVVDTQTPEWLFNEVTGLDIKGEGADFVSQAQRFTKEKNEELLANQLSTRSYQFDFFWEKSMAEKKIGQLNISDSDSEEDDEGFEGAESSTKGKLEENIGESEEH